VRPLKNWASSTRETRGDKPVCNLYSITTNEAAIIALFRVVNRYVGNLPPMPGVFTSFRRDLLCRGQLDHVHRRRVAAEALLSNRFRCRQWATQFRSGWFLFGWQRLDHNPEI